MVRYEAVQYVKNGVHRPTGRQEMNPGLKGMWCNFVVLKYIVRMMEMYLIFTRRDLFPFDSHWTGQVLVTLPLEVHWNHLTIPL